MTYFSKNYYSPRVCNSRAQTGAKSLALNVNPLLSHSRPKQISFESHENVRTIWEHPTFPLSLGKETHVLKIQSLPNTHTDLRGDEETVWESRKSEWSDIEDRTVLIFNSFNWSDDLCFWLLYCYCVLVILFLPHNSVFPFYFSLWLRGYWWVSLFVKPTRTFW